MNYWSVGTVRRDGGEIEPVGFGRKMFQSVSMVDVYWGSVTPVAGLFAATPR